MHLHAKKPVKVKRRLLSPRRLSLSMGDHYCSLGLFFLMHLFSDDEQEHDERAAQPTRRNKRDHSEPASQLLMGGASPPARLLPPQDGRMKHSDTWARTTAGIKPGIAPSSCLAPAHNPDPEDPRFDCPHCRSMSTSSMSTGRWPQSSVVLEQGVAALAAPRGIRGALLLPSWWQLLSQYQHSRSRR